MKKYILFLLCVLIATSPLLYAQNEVKNDEKTKMFFKPEPTGENRLTGAFIPAYHTEKAKRHFFDFIGQKAYAATVDKEQEKITLREKWQGFLRIDVFYPYFKVKEAEDWISEKFKVEFFKIKGRAKFEDDQIKYIFKIKF